MQTINKIKHTTNISNVLVIGSGGAGLRAAIEAKLSGVEVTVIGRIFSGSVAPTSFGIRFVYPIFT